MSKQLTVGSLFAGIGGFDLGFQRAGFEISWQAEIDQFCQKVLSKHFPEAKRYGDIRTVGAANLDPVDVICGGFPCQDISIAGKGAGLAGERSGLWFEMHRIISELRPKYVVVENVRRLLTLGLDRVLGTLAEIGYDAEWEIISAGDIGAPHRRERLWVVAYSDEIRRFHVGNTRGEEIISDENRIVEGEERRREERELGVREVCNAVAPDTGQERIQRVFTQEIPRFPAFSWCQDVRRLEDLRGRPDLPEPLFRGGRDGIPNWMDRIGACGNAVVPQIPEWIANQILQYENRSFR